MKKLYFIILLNCILNTLSAQECLQFDGNNDRITTDPMSLSSVEQSNFTLEAWIQGEDNQNSSFPMIFSNRNTSSDGMMFFFHDGFNKELCVQMNGANLKLENNGSYGRILDGERHHVAITRDMDSLSYYVDGEHIGSRGIWFDNATLVGDGELLIGYDGPTGNPFEGLISNIRVWNTNRTEAEIKSTMLLQLPANVPNLVMNFPLTEGEGTTVTDLANGNKGEFGGEGLSTITHPVWGIDCPSFETLPVDPGYCLSFDGEDDKIVGSNRAINSIGDADFTLEAWIQSEGDDFSRFPMILSNRSASSNGMLFSFHDEDINQQFKELYLQMNNTNYRLNDNGGAGNLLDGNRHHVAISREDQTLTFYINGILRGTRTVNNPDHTLVGNSPLIIGYDAPTENPFSGILSNIRVWDIAKNESEIQSTMNSTLPSGTENLVVNYPLNEGSTNQVMDRAALTLGIFGGDISQADQHPSWISECLTFTDISENNYSSILNAYPNPTSRILFIELDDYYEHVDVEIFNLAGEKVLSRSKSNVNALELDVSDLPASNYMTSITTGRNTSVMKLVIVK